MIIRLKYVSVYAVLISSFVFQILAEGSQVNNVLPTVEVEIEWDKLSVGTPARFKAIAKDSDGKIVKYLWKFGKYDEFTEAQDVVMHTFQSDGPYTVSVKVTDNGGGHALVEHSLEINSRETPPKFSIQMFDEQGIAGSVTSFAINIVGSASHDGSIEWAFGDGATKISSVYAKVDHVFKNTGEFDVSAKLLLSNGVTATSHKKVIVTAATIKSLTTPNQVLLSGVRSYTELVPTQKVNVSAIAYSDVGGIITPTSVVWSASNSNVTIINQTGSTATLKGVAAGTSTVKAIINGVDSQEITVVVQSFTNNVSVAKDGEYFDSGISKVYVAVNDSTNAYTVTNEFSDYATSFSSSGTCDSAYRCGFADFELPSPKVQLGITAKRSSNPTIFYDVTKTPLKQFESQGGMLLFPKYTYPVASVSLSDNRFSQFDNDFSISFWHSAETAEIPIAINASGNFELIVSGAYLTVQSNADTKKIFFPRKKVGSWGHVAVTYVESTRTIKGYLDGYFIGSAIVPNVPLSNNPQNVLIYPTSSGSENSLDDLRFWNKELNSAEIKAEMFTPVILPSSSLVASFGFGLGTNEEEQLDENGGGSKLLLLSSVPFSSPPVVIRKNILGSVDLFVDNQFYFSSVAPLDIGKLIVTIPENTFSTDIRYGESIMSCLTLCRTSRFSYMYDLSPIFQFTPKPSPVSNYEIIMPFDSHSPDINDYRRIKIMTVENRNGVYRNYLMEPDEVNMEKGYVTTSGGSQDGSYWIVNLDYGYFSNKTKSMVQDMKNEYSNADLRPSFVVIDGKRTFLTTISASATSYDLNIGSVGGSAVEDAYCLGGNGVVSLADYNSGVIHITNLSLAENFCEINYSLFDADANEYIYHTDLFIIKRI